MSLDVQHVGVPSIYNSDGSFLECNCYLGVTNAGFLFLSSAPLYITNNVKFLTETFSVKNETH